MENTVKVPILCARIRKGSSGPSPTYVITVPADYIKNGYLNEGQIVDVTIEFKQKKGDDKGMDAAGIEHATIKFKSILEQF